MVTTYTSINYTAIFFYIGAIPLISSLLLYYLHLVAGNSLLYKLSVDPELKESLLKHFERTRWYVPALLLFFLTSLYLGRAEGAFFGTRTLSLLLVSVILCAGLQSAASWLRGKENVPTKDNRYDILLSVSSSLLIFLISILVATTVFNTRINSTAILFGIVVFLSARTLAILYTIERCRNAGEKSADLLSQRVASKLIASGIGLLLFLCILLVIIIKNNSAIIFSPILWFVILMFSGLLLIGYGVVRSILLGDSNFKLVTCGVIVTYFSISAYSGCLRLADLSANLNILSIVPAIIMILLIAVTRIYLIQRGKK